MFARTGPAVNTVWNVDPWLEDSQPHALLFHEPGPLYSPYQRLIYPGFSLVLHQQLALCDSVSVTYVYLLDEKYEYEAAMAYDEPGHILCCSAAAALQTGLSAANRKENDG